MQTLLQDFRFALRQLRKNPGFALTAILSLALGIGATVSVFSIIYSVLLNPWPYADSDHLYQIHLPDKSGNDYPWSLTGPQIRQLRQTHAIADISGLSQSRLTVTGKDVPEDVAGIQLTGNTFQMLGVSAMLGRYFVPSDAPDKQDPQPVAVLGYKFWQRHYNGDPSVIGKAIELTHKSYTIIGVMPSRFTWYDGDVFLPLKMEGDQKTWYEMHLRLKPGVSPAAAEAELIPLYQQFDKERLYHFPKGYKLRVRNISYRYFHRMGATLSLLFGAVAVLLAIACGNVSILLLARGTARQHEFAVRSAVGASGFRIVRQLLTESLLLALTGTGLGVFLAYRSLSLIITQLPEHSFPHEADFHIHLPVMLFSVGVALLTGVLFSLFPALQVARPEIGQMMQSSTRKVAGSVHGKQLHTVLIAGQIALTLLLLTAAGAAIEGFLQMIHTPLGYDPHRVMSVGIPVHENTFTSWGERSNYFEQLRTKVGVMPGVVATAISTNATPPANGWTQPVEILGKPAMDQQEASVNFVSPEYFDVLHIPVRQGRLWDHTEAMRGAMLAIVNQAFVKRYFPNGDILGHSVRMPQQNSYARYQLTVPNSDGWLQVVGVTGDALNDGLDKPVKPAVFVPFTINMWLWTQILVRTEGEPLPMLHSIQQQIASVNPDQQIVTGSDTLETYIRQEPEWARGRLISILFAAFSALALVLAAVGLYSVVSYLVAQRTSEFGIRIALGARKIDVLKIVLASAGVSVGSGVVVGLALSLGLNRLIGRWVAGSAHNPMILLAVSTLLLAVCLLACLLPARRASSVDPTEALRCE